MPINGPALGALAIGGVFLYAAVKGKSILASAQALIQGKSPATVQQTNPITDITAADTTSTGTAGTPGSTNNAIANDALKYQGAGYVLGGSPANGIGHWDCSSFTNWVAGHDLGMAIPGFKAGTYNGTTHGPTTVSWYTYGLHVGNDPMQAQAGDICVWPTHMGIAIGGGQMISALDTKDGTKVTSIVGGAPTGEGSLLTIRRI